MDETMAVEQACTILNETKWRGRWDWTLVTPTLCNPHILSNAPTTFLIHYDVPDAIAIATGILAQRELAALRKAVEPFIKQARLIAAEDWSGLADYSCNAENVSVADWLALLATEQKEENNG